MPKSGVFHVYSLVRYHDNVYFPKKATSSENGLMPFRLVRETCHRIFSFRLSNFAFHISDSENMTKDLITGRRCACWLASVLFAFDEARSYFVSV